MAAYHKPIKDRARALQPGEATRYSKTNTLYLVVITRGIADKLTLEFNGTRHYIHEERDDGLYILRVR